jgi:hypothetical protein
MLNCAGYSVPLASIRAQVSLSVTVRLNTMDDDVLSVSIVK